MGMSVGVSEGDEEVMATINTTPLVDVMLVMLIIFLITVPVVIKTVPLELPTADNIATVTKPENIVIAVDRDGGLYWNDAVLPDYAALLNKFKEVAPLVPQPEIHIRGDSLTRFEGIGKVIVNAQRAGIVKLGFITQPDLSNR
ncbi:MAG: biopolymer transporter ExbD [Alphaproteobacteria bacterium]|nr:biopolymer transporter ExbD [Alphaproteobacteria bacterium]PHX98215.1 MAG: biopolymer transporter ExbD [Rhodospirillaceae bacterium]